MGRKHGDAVDGPIIEDGAFLNPVNKKQGAGAVVKPGRVGSLDSLVSLLFFDHDPPWPRHLGKSTLEGRWSAFFFFFF